MTTLKTILNRIVGWLRCNSSYAGLALVSGVYGSTLYLLGGLPIGGDILIPFNHDLIVRYAFSWNQWVDQGTSIPYVLAGPPLLDASIYAAMEQAGLNLLVSTWFYFAVMSFVGAASCCYLLRTLVPATRASAIPGFVAGLVFLYNPLYIVDTYKSLFVGLAERAVFPLAIALFAIGLQKKDLRYSLGFAAVSFVLLGRFPVISTKYGVATIAAIATISAFMITSSPFGRKVSQAKFSLRYLSSCFLVSLAVNAYWIIPYIFLSSTYNATLSAFKLDFGFNATSTVVNVLRLLGPWPFYGGYAPYSNVYLSNPIVIASTFGLPLLAMSPLVFERSRRVSILAIITATLIFLSKGTNDPFGNLYQAMVSGSILRVFYISDIFQWFLLFAYCLMIGIAAHSVVRRLHVLQPNWSTSLRKVLVLSLMVLPLLIASWPLLTGDVMTNYYSPSQKGVSIPSSYFETADWLRTQDAQSRVFVAQSTGEYSSTSWGFQGATQFYQLFFPSSIVTGTGTQYSSASNILRSAYRVFDEFSLQTPIFTYGNWSFQSLENSTWTSYQSDTVTVVNDSSEIGPYINWQIMSTNTSIHEISKQLPTRSDWTGFDLLVVGLRGNFDPAFLSVGIGDSRVYVGFYDVANHVRLTSNGWQILFLPLNTPDESTYNLTSVSSMWLRYFPHIGESAQISVAQIHLAHLSYDSIDWAKTLGLFSAKYVLTDSSLVQNKWTYPVQDNMSAFSDIYERGPLMVHLNHYTSSMIYGARSVSLLSQGEDPVSLISEASFVPNETAFVTDQQIMTNIESSALSSPNLAFEADSPTSYRVHFINTGPFVLVLSQTFDAGWTSCLVGASCFAHFLVNGYANGWYIDAMPGEHDMRLQFGGQSAYEVALGISIASLLAIVSTLTVTTISRLRQNEAEKHERH